MIKPSLRLLALSPIAALVLGCASSGTTVVPPTLDLPPLQQGAQEDLSQWWQRFNDPALNALIERALANNADLKVAAARVEESAALLRVSRADLLPDAGISVDASRNRATEHSAIPRPAGTQITNDFSATLQVSYEVDLWGRVRDANDAALAQLMASREAQNGLRSSLAAQVAQGWYNLLAADRKLALTQDTLKTRDEALALQRKLFESGNTNPLNLRQAESERETVAASLPRLISAQASAERALAVLTGGSPREIAAAGTQVPARPALPEPPAVPAGIPSDLLQRRPDVRQAEASLAAAQANVGEARASYFPTIKLTGSYGRESDDLSNLFSGPSTVWGLGTSLLQPLLLHGRIQAQVEASEARRKQAEASYVGVVRGAFREVYDSLGNLQAANDTAQAEDKQIGALRDTLRIAQRRYDVGYAAYLEVLDAQRNLLNAETSRIDAQAQRLSSTVDVFRALGGGWQVPATAAQAGAEKSS